MQGLYPMKDKAETNMADEGASPLRPGNLGNLHKNELKNLCKITT